MANPDSRSPAPSTTASGLKRFWREVREHHGGFIRGTLRQQRQMAISERQAAFLKESKDAIERVRNMKVQPTRVETFEDACARLKLTPAQLQAQFEGFRRAHLCLYALSLAFVVYAFWLSCNGHTIASVGVISVAVGAAANGYIHGFRAWQVANRRLIRLQQALRIPGTYLVV